LSRPPRTATLALYGAATGLLEPLAPLVLRRRAAGGKEDAARLAERLGRASVARPDGPLAWLHGVSVGESLSLLPLVAALRERQPRLNLLVTSGTVTSVRVLTGRLPPGVIHQFAPVDAPGVARRFLDHWRPDAALFVESELWPNLLGEAARRGVRLALVSARMTDTSARGWARAPASARALLRAFDVVLPQDEASAGRLERLGAQPLGRLNLKLLGDAPPVDATMRQGLMQAAAGRSIVLAASTHPGEEAIVADALSAATAGGPSAFLVVAPRHPERGPQVAAELAAAGFKVGRRAAGDPLTADLDSFVLDSLGELGAVYAGAQVVIMGGSFLDGIGGHNPLEAARLGATIVTGPHVANAASLYDSLLAETAAIRAADRAALARHVGGLLRNPMIARRMGEAALDFAGRQAAELDAALALIEPLLPA
jgi:3-deoxy-D-manno-octulosonic-acid transferase